MDNLKYETLKARVGSVEESADAMIELLSDPDLSDDERNSSIHEIWSELTSDEMIVIWRAKNKGGYFTQAEKDILRPLCRSTAKSNSTTDKEKAA